MGAFPGPGIELDLGGPTWLDRTLHKVRKDGAAVLVKEAIKAEGGPPAR